MLKAVSQAPVSVVQPVSGCGLAVLAVFSHFYLHEVMHGLDWVGVVMASLGTIVIGALGEEQKEAKISLARSLLFLVWLALFFGIIDCCVRSGKRRHEKHDEGDVQMRDVDVMEELAAGMEAGTCFGLSASVCKVGFMLAERGLSQWFVPAGIAVGICCSSSGFFCQTRGLKNGRAVVVSTCAAVASIMTGVLVGLFALGESLPASTSGRLLLLLAWGLIVVGIIVILLSEKIALMLPRSLRRVLKPKASPPKAYLRTAASASSRRDVGTSNVVHVKVSSS
nr:probable magnesium transporter NIPA9 isoform X2 [Physcomitrium patens]|eukprot:XP_024380289.1 probable magnesium transporter NIPA9 isoform X2 [Physcomitrella patens]